ncbi:MAG TPA: hypothetical protein VJC03_04265, partial [bacterium]|nr:hypothetical protein [bacterium]
KWREGTDIFPGAVSLSGSYRVHSAGTGSVLLSAGAERYGKLPVSFKAGAEYNLLSFLSLRAGYGENLTLGSGLKFGDFSFNYAYLLHPLGENQRFDLSYEWGIAGEDSMKRFTRRMAASKVKEYWRKGQEHYQKKEYELALAEWEKAFVWDPSSAEIENRIRQVSAELEHLLSKKIMEERITRGYRLYYEGKLKESLKEWEGVMMLEPDNARAAEYLELITKKLTAEEKEQAFQEAELKKEARIQVLLQEGEELLAKNDFASAIGKWNEIFILDRRNEEAALRIRKTEEAVASLFLNREARGRSFFQKGEYSAARKYFSLALKLREDEEVRRMYDESRSRMGKQIASEIDRKKIERMYFQAADRYINRRYSEADNILDAILSLDPENGDALKLKEKVEATMELFKK